MRGGSDPAARPDPKETPNPVYIKVLLKDPVGETVDGRMFIIPGGLEWAYVPQVPDGRCEHIETACTWCLPIWATDHFVRHPGEHIDPDAAHEAAAR